MHGQIPLALADATATPLVQPALLFLLCIVAAIGMILLLPGRRETSIRKLGGVVLLAVLLIVAALLAKQAAGLNVYFWIFSAIAIVGAVRVITHTKPVYSALYFVLTVMASAGLFVLMNAEFMAVALVLIYAGAILVTYIFVIMLASEAAPPRTSDSDDSAVYGLAPHDAISREPIAASAIGFALVGVMLFVIFDRADVQVGDTVVELSHSAPVTEEVLYGEAHEVPVVQPFIGINSNNIYSRAKPRSAELNATIERAILKTPIGNQHDQPVTPDVPAFIPTGQTQQLGAYLFDKQLINLELAGLILTVAMVGAIMIAQRRIVKTESDSTLPPEMISAVASPIDDDPHSIPVMGTMNPRQKEYPER